MSSKYASMFLFSFIFPRLACAPEPIANAALSMEMQRWRLDRQIHAEKEAQPLEMDLTVMPIGTDADNSTVRAYWKANPIIPSGKIFVAVTLDFKGNSAPYDEEILNDISMRIIVDHAKRGQLIDELIAPIPEYTINIGTDARGDLLLRAAILNIHGAVYASAAVTFQVAPLPLTPNTPDDRCGEIFGTDPEGARDYSPPVRIPLELCNAFTLNGSIPVQQWYFDDKSNPTKSYQYFGEQQILEYMRGVREKKTYYYGDLDKWLYSSLDAFPIAGKNVLILGRLVIKEMHAEQIEKDDTRTGSRKYHISSHKKTNYFLYVTAIFLSTNQFVLSEVQKIASHWSIILFITTTRI